MGNKKIKNCVSCGRDTCNWNGICDLCTTPDTVDPPKSLIYNVRRALELFMIVSREKNPPKLDITYEGRFSENELLQDGIHVTRLP